MMFRLVNRLKKKHGAVLFVVIAVMALLIAMSSAAYYTARGSYNTVASSYSYSQLYLSAISAADMISSAIMNEEVPVAGGGNKFAAVQTAVNQYLTPTFATDGTYTIPTDVIYLKSDNLSTLTFDASTTTAQVVAALRTANNPVEPGVLDGLTVKISLLNAGAPQNVQVTQDMTLSNSTVKVENEKFTMKMSYSIETTAYYRDDTITVQDIVSNDKKFERQKNTPLKNVPGPGGSFPPLNPNTTTGQGKPDANGVVGSSGRAVLVSVKRLDGDMSFHNDITYIGSQANNVGNKIDGSLSADGSVYFSKCNVNVTGQDQHWYIGEDFVTTNDQAGTIKLGKNNLYVGGDMILGTQQGIQAEEVFVNGDLYVLKQCKIDTKKLHVSGNIYFTDYNSDGTPRPAAETLAASLDTVIADTGNVNSRLSGNFELELGGSVVAEGKTAPYERQEWWPVTQVVTVQDQITSGQNVKVGDKYSNIKDKSDYTQINGAESFSSTAQLESGFTVLDRDDDQDKYTPIHKEGSLLDAIAQNTNKTTNDDNQLSKGDQISYPNYTAKSTAYQNSLNLDFSDMEEITEEDANGNKKVIGYKKECDILDGSGNTIGTAKIKVNGTDKKDVTVNIPYVEDGFVLSYGNTNFMNGDLSNNATIKYNIAPDPAVESDPDLALDADSSDGQGKTMPIVLAANTSDGNFSWKGDSYGDNGCGAYVSVRDGMKVSFEMGNLDTTDNTYKPYDYVSDSSNNMKIPTYLLGAKTAVGSESLIDMMKSQNEFYVQKDENNGAMKIGNSILNEGSIPDNNIMIVSNSTDIAFRADYKDTLIGGYLYAPGGQLAASNNTNGAVINIGSVVISDYEANHADYQVKLPKPSDMDAFIGPLTNKKEENIGGNVQEDPNQNPTYSIPTYQFGDWNIVGSNYVGG